MNILIADDEKGIRAGLSKLFERKGYDCFTAGDYDSALDLIRHREIHLALLDIRIGNRDGVDLLKDIKKTNPDVCCLMITGYGSIANAVEAIRSGADDYMLKPLDNDYLLSAVTSRLELKQLKNENTYLREKQKEEMLDFDFSTTHPAMIKLMDVADRVKDTDTTVLITGESGTGKEVLSRYIHYSSNRKNAPFVGVNCAALSETLLLSELFGHEKGSFTGAQERKIGKFELADRGTLFLDEIGDMSLDAQAKLLRVLEESSLERLGGNRTINVNIRVIAATNQDLRELMEQKKFREDLFYRLNVIRLELPALRERPDDIPLLAEYFRKRYSRDFRKQETFYSEEALEKMRHYPWPGNIRELRNLVNQSVLLSDSGSLDPLSYGGVQAKGTAPALTPPRGANLQEMVNNMVEEFEKDIIRKTLEKHKFNKTAAAEELGVTRKTLFNKISRYGL
ncbi:MAG: sigma-54 dependent transcriptional regulator [Spirochaetales bacterium]|nr:sigma-54 dependent transcriptional regulator [Spirochaetales bacterium]